MEHTPLYSALLHHRELGRASFHTPGHKGNPLALPQDLLSLDFTELPDTDSLFEADGVIAQAEQHAAQVFGTNATLFSAGGCTLCIQAMLRLCSMNNKRAVVVSRVLHRSAVNAMALLDLTPVWLMPKQSAGEGLPGRITPESVRAALEQNPDAAAVYLTSPDYFGVVSPIQEIAEVCRSFQVPLLVDNAHGAHLWYTSLPHPLTQGATMTADSPHKTLPVLTGGAWLQISEERFVADAKQAMALFGSTSPSYPVMASLDRAVHWLETEGKTAYAALEQTVSNLRVFARSLGYTLPLGPCDPTRLSLCTRQLGISGVELAECFRKHGVEPEHWDDEAVVLIATPWNTPSDFERLRTAMEAGIHLPKTTVLPHPPLPALPEMVCSPREAMFAPQERILLKDSIGRIAADTACPCPPGIPVVMPGERITAEAVSFLERYGFLDVKVVK